MVFRFLGAELGLTAPRLGLMSLIRTWLVPAPARRQTRAAAEARCRRTVGVESMADRMECECRQRARSRRRFTRLGKKRRVPGAAPPRAAADADAASLRRRSRASRPPRRQYRDGAMARRRDGGPGRAFCS